MIMLQRWRLLTNRVKYGKKNNSICLESFLMACLLPTLWAFPSPNMESHFWPTDAKMASNEHQHWDTKTKTASIPNSLSSHNPAACFNQFTHRQLCPVCTAAPEWMASRGDAVTFAWWVEPWMATPGTCCHDEGMRICWVPVGQAC